MKIGIDLDDVLANFRDGWLKYYNKKFGTRFTLEDWTSYDLQEVFGEDKELIVKRITDFYRTNAFSQLEPDDGSQEVINNWKEAHELYVVTSRPTWVGDITHSWIERNFPDTFQEVILTNQFASQIGQKVNTKAEICKTLGISLMLEDSPSFTKDVNGCGVDVILFDRGWNQHVKESAQVTRVYSWKEAGNLVAGS